MTSQERTFELLLELGNPADPRTRAELLDRALRTALALLDADAVSALTPTHQGSERLLLHSGSACAASVPTPAEGTPVIRAIMETCRPVVLVGNEKGPLGAADACPGVEPGPVLFTPVHLGEPSPGYLAVYRRRGRAGFNGNDTRLMLLLTAWLGTALQNLRLANGAQKRSVMDLVSDVYSERFLRKALRRELRRASRFGQELSIVTAEIDQLETCRTDSGAMRTNVLIREAAKILADQVRSIDLVGAHGEGRFLAVLPQTGAASAIEVAERMRGAVERHSFSSVTSMPITVSLGVASFPQESADLRGLTAACARALEQARNRGGNCVATLCRADDGVLRLSPPVRRA